MPTTPAFVQINEGTGKKLAYDTYTENAQVVYDQKVIPGEYYLPSYSIAAHAVSAAAAASHVWQLMAGGTLNVRIRRMWLHQYASATAVGTNQFQVLRLTTAGTGGGALTPGKYDNADAAAGAAGMTQPTVKGTESTILLERPLTARQAFSTASAQADDVWAWEQHPQMKPIIIPAGAANGLALKSTGGSAGLTVDFVVEFVETSF